MILNFDQDHSWFYFQHFWKPPEKFTGDSNKSMGEQQDKMLRTHQGFCFLRQSKNVTAMLFLVITTVFPLVIILAFQNMTHSGSNHDVLNAKWI